MCTTKKNSISHPERVCFFFSVSETLCASEYGDNGRKKSIFSSTLVYIPLKITFLSDKQATALNCSRSLSELTFSFISQYILPYFGKILCEEIVLMIQVISENSLVKNSWGLGIFELFRMTRGRYGRNPVGAALLLRHSHKAGNLLDDQSCKSSK